MYCNLKQISVLSLCLFVHGTGWAAVWSSEDYAPPTTYVEPEPTASTQNPHTYDYDYPDPSEEISAWETSAPPATPPELSVTTPSTPAAVAPPATQASVMEEAAQALMGPEEEYDFGDFTSQALTVKAWESLILDDYPAVDVYTKKCIELYEAKAKEQQAQLSGFAPDDQAFQYWALNDVATCYFIWGKALGLRNQVSEAKEKFHYLMKNFPYAQAWDSRGWFWKVADAAKDMLTTVGTPYDFGDYTSSTLATKGWEVLASKDYKGVEMYAKKCIELYEKEALKQQAGMTDFAPKEKAFDPWALNDVATSYFLLGEAYAAQKKFREARAAYQTIIDNFGYAQAWDPKGWFWKIAVAAKGRFRKIAAMEKRGW